MNTKFKEEFKNLNPEDIKNMLDSCGGHSVFTSNKDTCFIKFFDDDNYGFWIIQWGLQKVKCLDMTLGCGFYKNTIKLTPFRAEFDMANDSINPYVKPRNRKSLEEYLQLYIGRKCPHYSQAIREETEKFIKRLETFNFSDDDLSI